MYACAIVCVWYVVFSVLLWTEVGVMCTWCLLMDGLGLAELKEQTKEPS